MILNDALDGNTNKRKRTWLLPLCGVLAVLALNTVISAMNGDPLRFFRITAGNGLRGPLINILNNGAQTALAALGMALVVACCGGPDLSVGAVMALSGCLCCTLMIGPGGGNVRSAEELQMPVLLAILGGIALAGLCGAFNGLLAVRLKLPAAIATLLLYGGGRSLCAVITNRNTAFIRVDEFTMLGGTTGMVPVQAVIAAGCALLLYLLLRFTRWGRQVRQAEGAASPGVVLGCFVLCGLLAGTAGVLVAARVSLADVTIGQYMELDALLAVALSGGSLWGKRVSLAGVLAGAFTVQALNYALYSMPILSVGLTQAVKAALLIVMLAAQCPQVKAYFAERKAGRADAAAAAERSGSL